jgi:inward rectifier potassium channel
VSEASEPRTSPAREPSQAHAEFKPILRPEEASVRVGFPFTPLTDLYYLLLKGSWTAVLLVFAAVFLVTNVIFAGLYLLGGDCIAGAEPGSFADAFFFSIQTIATIGYGTLTPSTTYANLLVTVESMIGILGVAIVTGITFAKFGRPRPNVRFSNNVIIAPYDGRRSLYFRVANVRGNDVTEATISVAALVSHVTREGHTLRRLEELPLVRQRSPLFRLSWLVVHVIDEASPLYGATLEDLYRDRTMLIVSLMGMDATFASSVNARHVYLPQDVVFDHHFEDMITELEDGRLCFDFHKFHAVRPLTEAEQLAGSREEIEEENSELLEAEAEDACVGQE